MLFFSSPSPSSQVHSEKRSNHVTAFTTLKQNVTRRNCPLFFFHLSRRPFDVSLFQQEDKKKNIKLVDSFISFSIRYDWPYLRYYDWESLPYHPTYQNYYYPWHHRPGMFKTLQPWAGHPGVPG